MRGRWWRLLAVPVAMLILVGCSVAGGGSDRPPGTTAVTAVVVPAVPPVPRPPARSGGPLVGVIQRDAAAELVRLDPRTLRPLPGARLELPGAWPLLAVAPDRSVAVLGSDVGRLTVVDLVHLRRLGDLPTGVPGDATLGWGWVGPSRLLLLGSAEQSVTDVLAVDVVARRVIGRHRIDGVAQAS